MIVLGVETSCDETAIALVEDGRKVLASEVSSQIKIHEKFAGVVPEIAAREHLSAVSLLFEQAMAKSQLSLKDVDLIAVTQGPGLIGALLVGISFAKGLSTRSAIPLMPVNHVHAHVHGALLGLPPEQDLASIFPCYALVISGGHTHIYRMEDPLSFSLRMFTIDDACGECFDKVGKLLGLPYPGGPHIERMAKNGNPDAYPIPKVLSDSSKEFFSYSGLKTHMLTRIKGKSLSEKEVSDHCASFQREAFRQIVDKLQNLLQNDTRPIASILVAGGVAANATFRKMLQDRIAKPILFPNLRFCSDNAAMIAAVGWHKYRKDQGQTEHAFEAFSSYPYNL